MGEPSQPASHVYTPSLGVPHLSQIGSGVTPATGDEGQHAQRYMFQGEIEKVRALIPVLKAICIKRTAVMAITACGLKISCEEDSRAVQSTAFIDRNLFKKYELRDDSPQSLCFRMSDLLSAISILFPIRPQNEQQHFLEHSNLLRIKFERLDRLKLQVVNGDHSAMAYIQTYQPVDLMVFSMAFVNKIIVDASALIDFWKCADTTSSHVRIRISDSDPWFEMSTDSNRGRFLNRITHQSSHVEHYECTVPLTNRYPMDSMKSTLRPLLLASRVSIRMDTQGLLNMQFLIRLDSDSDDQSTANSNNRQSSGLSTPQNAQPMSQEVSACFVEFYIVPSVSN